MKSVVIFLLISLSTTWLYAQEGTIAYKVENYEFSYTDNLKLKTNCEMADLIIVKGNGDKVTIKCTYSAKHSDKQVAAKELGRHNIRVKKTLNEIFVSNFFTVMKGEGEPKAKLNVKFEISIPKQVHLETDNNFGSTRVENLSIRGKIQQDFGKLELKKVIANMELSGKLCDMSVVNSTGILHCTNKTGDILIDQFNGKEISLKNSNAQIKLNAIQSDVSINVELSNCTMVCSNMNYQQRALDIRSYKEPIKVNGSLVVESKNNYFTILNKKSASLFQVKADYSKITLN